MKKEIYINLAKQAGYAEPEIAAKAATLADLVYKDVMRTLAAHALSNVTALEAFSNMLVTYGEPNKQPVDEPKLPSYIDSYVEKAKATSKIDSPQEVFDIFLSREMPTFYDAGQFTGGVEHYVFELHGICYDFLVDKDVVIDSSKYNSKFKSYK